MSTEGNRPTKIVMALLILMNCIFVGAVVYTLYTRSFNDFVQYSLLTAIPFFLFGLVSIISDFETEEFKDWIMFALGFPGVCLAAVFGGGFFYSLGVALKDGYSAYYYQWLLNGSISDNWKYVSVIVFVLIFGTGFFFFRKKMRITYGITECLIGIIAAVGKIPKGTDQPTNNDFYLAILTASIYLIVRGLDNVREGVERESDPFALNLYAFLTRRKNRKDTKEDGER